MEINHNYADVRPEFITFQRNLGRNVYTINFNIEEIDTQDEETQKFSYESVTLQPGNDDYGNVVSALIHSRYTDDDMQAIINNYLDAPDNQEYNDEFKDMQDFRKQAKAIAKEFVASI